MIETCRTRGLAHQAGVHSAGQVVDHHISPQPGSLELGHNVADVTPTAQLPASAAVNAEDAGVGGTLRSAGSVDAAKGLTGQPAVIGAVMPSDGATSVGTSISSTQLDSSQKVMPTDVPTANDQRIGQTDAEVHNLKPEDAVMSNTDATKPKKGFFGKVKSALTP